MTDTQLPLRRRSLTSPRAAAVAGILFTLLYGAGVVLILMSIPKGSTPGDAWLEADSGTITLGLNLMPYAGIAFLWFIGVIRDHLGDAEDRLFATVFLGSGLLFLALTFVGMALAGGLLSSYAVASTSMLGSGVLIYGRSVIYQIISVYAIRMAGVFMISLGTIWLRIGMMHRGWSILTYTLALILLVTISYSLWMTLVFPTWVLAVSVYILIHNQRDRSPKAVGEGGSN